MTLYFCHSLLLNTNLWRDEAIEVAFRKNIVINQKTSFSKNNAILKNSKLIWLTVKSSQIVVCQTFCLFAHQVYNPILSITAKSPHITFFIFIRLSNFATASQTDELSVFGVGLDWKIPFLSVLHIQLNYNVFRKVQDVILSEHGYHFGKTAKV